MASVGPHSPIKFHLELGDQLQVLKSRNLLVADDGCASSALSNIGYYRLSGYWYPLRERCVSDAHGRKDTFAPGTSFEDVVALYDFDKVRCRECAMPCIVVARSKFHSKCMCAPCATVESNSRGNPSVPEDAAGSPDVSPLFGRACETKAVRSFLQNSARSSDHRP